VRGDPSRACSARSCKNPRIGAIPLPAQTMTSGIDSAGGWNATFLGRTVTATFVPGRAFGRLVDTAPSYVPRPASAATLTTATVSVGWSRAPPR
jgi:hypothetical protein